MTKRRPAPWKAEGSEIFSADEGRVAITTGATEAKRIVACVNALEGIADPSVVPLLLSVLKTVLHSHDSQATTLPARVEELVRIAIDRAKSSEK